MEIKDYFTLITGKTPARNRPEFLGGRYALCIMNDNSKHAVEIARKRLENTAYEVAAKYGLEIHSVHFTAVTTEDDPKPHLRARLCYTDTRDEQVTTTRE